MKIEHDHNLSGLNTFGVKANAKLFVDIHSEQDLKELFNTAEFKNNSKLFLGGGSNVLFTRDFNGLVILNKLKGIEVLEAPMPESVGKDFVYVRAMGGEIWHDLVIFSVERGYWGIENLALIPGTVGAAPMQNIGAYGVELASVLENVEAYEIETGTKRVFTMEDCQLGYRDSIFKNSLKGQYFISATTLKLRKVGEPNINYKILREYLENNKIEPTTPQVVSDAVANIRRSKLPNPIDIPNAGSFFKNVFVTPTELEKLQKEYPDIPNFQEDSSIKIPSAWLIEQSGWKGKKVGNVGVHDKQALVLVNHGGASGQEVKDLAERIIVDVKEKFGLDLVSEVNVI